NSQTSGSTGMPFRCKVSQSLETMSCALTERMFRWWRVDGKKAFAQITQSTSSGAPPRGGKVMQGWNSARPTGTKYFLSHRFDLDTQLDLLLARPPAYLAPVSGIIKDLALTLQRRGIELKFELLFSCAAPVDSELRALCRSVFGAEIADTYGAREAGHLAAQCPSCGDGSPAASGETGRVVVTPLYNYAMPLIRYELGDYAEVGGTEPPCGIKLPTLRRILGRHRNLFRFRDGTRVWPVATLFHLHRFHLVHGEARDVVARRRVWIDKTEIFALQIRDRFVGGFRLDVEDRIIAFRAVAADLDRERLDLGARDVSAGVRRGAIHRNMDMACPLTFDDCIIVIGDAQRHLGAEFSR